MTTTSPTRVDDELYASAKLVGPVMDRSAAQQIAHWARLGREIEASGQLSYRDITAALEGRVSYDELGPREQAVVRAEWAERLEARRAALDLAATFTAAGHAFAELDDDGQVVVHAPLVGGDAATASDPSTASTSTGPPSSALSDRDEALLGLLADGCSKAEIAAQLDLPVRKVTEEIARVCQVLARDRVHQAASAAVRSPRSSGA